MSSFSAPVVYSTTSTDTITIDTSSINSITASSLASSLNTVTINGSGYYMANGSGAIGSIIPTNNISNIGNVGIGTSSYTYQTPEEFVNCMPDISRIKAMCEEYPGLKIAYEKFVTTYKLVKDHYDTPKDQRPLP